MADTIMAPRLSEVNRVGRVFGARRYPAAIRIQAISAAACRLLRQSRSMTAHSRRRRQRRGPKGALDGAHQSYTIAANDQITVADSYKDIVVAFRNGAPGKDQ
jgi:multidrug efflux pump